MGFESEGFTPEEINAPQTVLHVAKEGQPRGSVGSFRTIAGGEDPSDDIFIEREGKGLGNLLGNLWAPKVGIAPFHLQHQLNEFAGRAFRAGLLAVRGRIQSSIFPLHHGLMKFQKRRRLNENGHPLDAARIQQGGPQA
jgi:hypothetical protein